jgi:DNA-directed RNA polymerase specialized sigma24 family protein
MSRFPDQNLNVRELELQADSAIIRRLADQDFEVTCRDWITLSEVLIEYGYSVLMGWLVGGGIYEAAAGKGDGGVLGLSRIPRDLKLDQMDAHDLTTMLLEAAIRRFHQTLRDGSWQPEKGARLSTFFVGRCLMQLPDVYGTWHRQQERWAREITVVDQVDDGRFTDDPCDAATAAVYLDEVLPPGKFEHVRVMLLLSESGYTMAEIAAQFTEAGLPCSEATVRTRISRARSLVRNRYRGERGGR